MANQCFTSEHPLPTRSSTPVLVEAQSIGGGVVPHHWELQSQSPAARTCCLNFGRVGRDIPSPELEPTFSCRQAVQLAVVLQHTALAHEGRGAQMGWRHNPTDDQPSLLTEWRGRPTYIECELRAPTNRLELTRAQHATGSYFGVLPHYEVAPQDRPASNHPRVNTLADNERESSAPCSFNLAAATPLVPASMLLGSS